MKKHPEKKSGISSMLSAFLETLFSSVQSRVVGAVVAGADTLFDHLEVRVLQLQKKMMRQLIVKLSLLAGVVALLFALIFYMTDVLLWNRHLILLATGVVLLMFASISANLWKE